jgi:hypothetical protein
MGDLLDLAVPDVDLVEQRRPLEHVEDAARGEQRVGLRAPKRDGAPSFARLDTPEVRGTWPHGDRLELGHERELAEVAAHRSRRNAKHRRQVL